MINGDILCHNISQYITNMKSYGDLDIVKETHNNTFGSFMVSL